MQLEKSPKINKRTPTFILESRVGTKKNPVEENALYGKMPHGNYFFHLYSLFYVSFDILSLLQT